MMPIQLLLPFSPSEKWIRHIDHDALVTIFVRVHSITWLVLSSDVLRNQHRHSSYRHSFGVKKMVGTALVVNSHVRTLRISLWLHPVHSQLVQFIRHLLKSVSNVWVKFDSSKFLFDFKIIDVFGQGVKRHRGHFVSINVVLFRGVLKS